MIVTTIRPHDLKTWSDSDLHVGVHDELKLLDAVLHGRPAVTLEADAARGEAGEHGHRLQRVGALAHVPVHHLAQLLPVAHHLVYLKKRTQIA